MFAAGGLDGAALRALPAALSSMPAASDDSERIDRIRALEELKSAAAAAQAVETAAFAASQRAGQAAAGVPAERVGRGISAQVGLARRESPFRAARYTGWATILVRELPHTFTALQQGRVSEWRAMILARETGWLSREHRGQVDALLAGRIEQLGDAALEAEAKKAAYRLDPYGYTARLANAENDRRVTVRPAPDVMARLSALLPVAQAVAAYAALRTHADQLIATGDPRSRGQIMADTLVQRLTGQATANGVPVEIHLVMTDTTLLGNLATRPNTSADDEADDDDADEDEDADDDADADEDKDEDADADADEDEVGDAGEDSAGENDDDDEAEADTDDAQIAVGTGAEDAGRNEPALLLGYGPVPAHWARELIHHTPEDTPMWIRRLYRHPHTGQLAAMDTRRRTYTANQRLFVRIRDAGHCRTPWCDAPIRHTDHVHPADRDGPTNITNAQGQCEACNYTKEAPGWTATVATPDTSRAATTNPDSTNPDSTNPDSTNPAITITTPTGHTYRHAPPEPVGGATPAPAPAPAPAPTSARAQTPTEPDTAQRLAALVRAGRLGGRRNAA